MLYAARTAGVKLIINVVLNGRRQIIGSFAGELARAHKTGVEFLFSPARVTKVPYDIAISTNGGYPLDQTSISRSRV
jgi:nickel-dependent lactate racemase